VPVSRLTLEYDGTEFAGWAAQPGLRTVQGELERVLKIVLRRDAVRLRVGGRTDRGVHARAQVASYTGEPAKPDSLNALLPDDVSVLSSETAPDGFDARADATSRAYTYAILHRGARSALRRGRAVHFPQRLDLGALQACASALSGRHDFTAFTPKQTEHVWFTRQIHASFWRTAGPRDELLEFCIEADAFLRHMNRVLVGTMLEVAGGQRTVESFVALLEGRPRSEAGRTAPAHGLYLAGIGYNDERVLG
jgi:tRNA pseudouridine38-40 synthase